MGGACCGGGQMPAETHAETAPLTAVESIPLPSPPGPLVYAGELFHQALMTKVLGENAKAMAQDTPNDQLSDIDKSIQVVEALVTEAKDLTDLVFDGASLRTVVGNVLKVLSLADRYGSQQLAGNKDSFFTTIQFLKISGLPDSESAFVKLRLARTDDVQTASANQHHWSDFEKHGFSTTQNDDRIVEFELLNQGLLSLTPLATGRLQLAELCVGPCELPLFRGSEAVSEASLHLDIQQRHATEARALFEPTFDQIANDALTFNLEGAVPEEATLATLVAQREKMQIAIVLAQQLPDSECHELTNQFCELSQAVLDARSEINSKKLGEAIANRRKSRRTDRVSFMQSCSGLEQLREKMQTLGLRESVRKCVVEAAMQGNLSKARAAVSVALNSTCFLDELCEHPGGVGEDGNLYIRDVGGDVHPIDAQAGDMDMMLYWASVANAAYTACKPQNVQLSFEQVLQEGFSERGVSSQSVQEGPVSHLQQVHQCRKSFNALQAHFLFVADEAPSEAGCYYPTNTIVVAVRGTGQMLDVVEDLHSCPVAFDIHKEASRLLAELKELDVEIDFKSPDATVRSIQHLRAPQPLAQFVSQFYNIQSSATNDTSAGHEHHVHPGILESATNLLKVLLPSLLCILETRPDHKIVFCGHSLGGGVAAVATMLLNHMFKSAMLTVPNAPIVKAVTFAPAAACDRKLALQHRDLIQAVVLESDLVPRLSFANIGKWFQLTKVAMDEVNRYFQTEETTADSAGAKLALTKSLVGYSALIDSVFSQEDEIGSTWSGVSDTTARAYCIPLYPLGEISLLWPHTTNSKGKVALFRISQHACSKLSGKIPIWGFKNMVSNHMMAKYLANIPLVLHHQQ